MATDERKSIEGISEVETTTEVDKPNNEAEAPKRFFNTKLDLVLYFLASFIGYFFVLVSLISNFIIDKFMNSSFNTFTVIEFYVFCYVVFLFCLWIKNKDSKSEDPMDYRLLNGVNSCSIFMLILSIIYTILLRSEAFSREGLISLLLVEFIINLPIIVIIRYFILDYLVNTNGMNYDKAKRVLYRFIVILFLCTLVIAWLKADDIAFFIAIVLSLSMSATTYENISSFLKKSNYDGRVYQLLEPPKIGNQEKKEYIDKYDKKEWDGKIQYDRIRLSILLSIAYIVFKFTEKIPLFFQFTYVIFNPNLDISKIFINKESDINTLDILDRIGFYFFQSLDKVIGFIVIVCLLLTVENIKKYIFIGIEYSKTKWFYKVFIWISFVYLFHGSIILFFMK